MTIFGNVRNVMLNVNINIHKNGFYIISTFKFWWILYLLLLYPNIQAPEFLNRNKFFNLIF